MSDYNPPSYIEMARLQTDEEAARRRQQQAQQLMQAGYNPVPNANPILSVLASVMSTIKGDSMLKDSDAKISEVLAKKFELQNREDQAKAEAEQRRRQEDIEITAKTEAKYRTPSFEEKLFNSLPENMRGSAALEKFGLGPKAGPAPSESERKIAQLRELGATDDQIRGMLLGNQGGQSAPSGYRPTADGALEPIPGGPADKPQEADPRQSVAHDALRFVAATTGTPIETLKKMTPDQVAKEFTKNSAMIANPILGNLPGASMSTNAIIKEMAAKQARVNNPRGTVTDADFKAAEAGLPALNRPDTVNAEIIRNILMQAAQGTPPQGASPAGASEQPPVRGAKKAPDGHWYVEQNGKFARVDP